MTIRNSLTLLLTLAAIAPLAARDAEHQATAKPGAAPPTACALLTKDVLAAHTPASPESFKLMLSVPPMEDKVGGGTACSYGGVTLQVDPFAAANFERLFGEWTPVSGVGTKAFFRQNRNAHAELAVLAGSRILTLQMSVPDGRTPSSIQPNVVGLAKAVLPKLK
jgi:hypothetical protein